MLQKMLTKTKAKRISPTPFTIVPDMRAVTELGNNDRREALAFLSIRPVHTVVMTSFINDNGIESVLNRGKFYGFRNSLGKFEGIALIGHTTLVEARSDEALKALAFQARSSETPIHVMMSSGQAAEDFWQFYTGGTTEPRLTCTEVLFEVGIPFLVQGCEWNIRLATMAELEPVAEAQAAIAFMECGVDPMKKDREGFLKRVARRIEQGRVFVVVEDGKLVFKTDIMAVTDETIYLEGVYVNEEYRGHGIGSACLARLSAELLNRVPNICMLSNVDFKDAHRSFIKAGYKATDKCTTLFV